MQATGENALPEVNLASSRTIKTDGDGFIGHGSQYKGIVIDLIPEGLSGFKDVACMKRDVKELGRPHRIL
jgi:hypothetical protein